MAEAKFPTEMVSLPSKGWFYDSDNPLSSGEVEVKYMTAKEEDILTSQNLIQKGVVFDKLLDALVVSDIKMSDMLIGDKNAVLIAARILGYGKDYSFKYSGEDVSVDLTELEQDVMILGLHTATARNSSETDLSSSHIIRFEDDTQIATETTGDRNATNECWSSVTETETAIPVKLLVTNGTNASSTVTDTSDSPMTVNTYGSPTWTTAAYKYGTTSMLLNGSSQFIYLDDHNNFDYGNDSNGFTFEMWFKQVSTTGEDGYGNMPLYGQSGSSSNGNPRNYLWRSDGDTLTHYHQGASPDGAGGDVSGATMEDGN